MATRKLTADDLKQIEKLAKGWGKIIVRQHWGEKGPGLDVDLTQMEDVAMAAVRAMLAGTLEVATEQQASQLGEQQACPECGRMCPLKREERPITVRTGAVFEHDEPKAHCPACRRDFFPSASDTEAGRARLQSVDLEQDRANVGSREVVPNGRHGSRSGG
jgi:hypothetical protein